MKTSVEFGQEHTPKGATQNCAGNIHQLCFLGKVTLHPVAAASASLRLLGLGEVGLVKKEKSIHFHTFVN